MTAQSAKPVQDAAYGVVIGPGTVRFERILPGPIERVWSYLTDSKKRSTWLAAGEMELRPGGQVEHIFINSKLTGHDDPPPAKYAGHLQETRMHGHILACEPPRLLAYIVSPGTDSGGCRRSSPVCRPGGAECHISSRAACGCVHPSEAECRVA